MKGNNKTIRLTEAELRSLIDESVMNVINEGKFTNGLKRAAEVAGFGALGTLGAAAGLSTMYPETGEDTKNYTEYHEPMTKDTVDFGDD